MLDLPEEERRVITLRFGLEDGRVMNVQEVAELSRCSKDWVKRIEGRALRKLRLPKHQQRLQQFFDAMPHIADDTFGATAKLSDMLC
eukprot:4965-Heterococcus_DN1.PRE.1